MSQLAVLLALPLPSQAVAAQQRSYVTYTLSNLSTIDMPATITLLEARYLLAASGITGFRTWEACLHLGNYLASPSCTISISGRNVLELGAGTGYLSILCAKYLNAAHVLASDGSDTIVENLSTNFYLNGLQDTLVIEAKDLKWGHALLGGEEEEWNRGRPVDVILGADVTYDSAIIPPLLATIGDLTELFPAVQILIAVTIRQERTFDLFMNNCSSNGLKVEEIDFPVKPQLEQEGPFYLDTIRLCALSKRRTSA